MILVKIMLTRVKDIRSENLIFSGISELVEVLNSELQVGRYPTSCLQIEFHSIRV